MSLSKTLYPLLSTALTQEDPSQHDWKIVDWDLKNQNKQTLGNFGHCILFVKNENNSAGKTASRLSLFSINFKLTEVHMSR